jgi:hypothetical protein
MRSVTRLAAGVFACWMLVEADVCAQQVTLSTPYHSLSDSFFEHMGTSWSLGGRNWFLNVGGSPTQAAPQFGGFTPNAGANFGFGFGHRGVSGQFAANWSQGFRQSFTSQVPSVTVQNGAWGVVSDTSQSPFVISYVPVVGRFPAVMHYMPVVPPSASVAPGPGSSGSGHDAVLSALEGAKAQHYRREQTQNEPFAPTAAPQVHAPAPPNDQAPKGHDDLVLIGPASPRHAAPSGAADEPTRKLAAARASSAGRPAPSVAEARRLHATEQGAQDDEAQIWLERGRHAEAMGKPNVAKVYYQMAARRAPGPLRSEILARIEALGNSSD